LKKVWVLLVSVVLLACTCAVPSIVATPIPTDALVPQPPVEQPQVQQSQPGSGLTVVRLDPADGDLASQLDVQAAAALELGQHMFVEFDASW
jgi:hypothetical protein